MKLTIFILLAVVSFSCAKKIIPANTVIVKPVVDSAFIGLQMHELTSAKDLNTLIEKIGDAKVVLLGEATHGTAEFYNWRAEISKRLITEKEFTAICVEGDWADGIRVNNFITGNKKNSSDALHVLQLFDRWPSFLWANTEFLSFMLWLNNYNEDQDVSKKITFHGTDLFSIMDAVDTMSKRLNDAAIKNVIEQFKDCFKPFSNDEHLYSKRDQKADCSNYATQLLELVKKYVSNKDSLFSRFFLPAALTVYDGERYLRSARNRIDPWNMRDNHMAESIKSISDANQKVIVWLHNSHAGDAFYSSTHWNARTSVGEILKQKMGEKNVYLVGFGTYSGFVTVAETWGGEIEQLRLANAENATWEQVLHSMGANDKYVILNDTTLNKQLQTKWIYTRSIGVIYHNNERSGMSLSRMAKRFDAYIFIDHTTAVHPLPVKTHRLSGRTDE